MNKLDLAMLARAFRDTGGFTDPEAAAALGVPLSSFCAMKNQRYTGSELSLAEIARRLRGAAPQPTGDLALALREYRARNNFSLRDAGVALGVSPFTLGEWEHGARPQPLAVCELFRRLAQPVEPRVVKAAARKQPLVTASELSARLRAWRRAHKLTQRMCAEALGIHVRTVLAWEHCTQAPCARVLKRTLDLLEQPPAGVVSTHGWLARNPKQTDRTFGPRLRAWRKARGLNQLAAAIALGLPRDQSLISDYEKGIQFPRPKRLAAIEAQIGGAK